MRGLHATVLEDSSGTCVRLEGEVDVSTATDLAFVLDDVIGREAPLLTIDLTGVTFLDSSGLRVLLRSERAVRESGGGLVLAGAGRTVSRILDMAGVAHRFGLDPDPEERSRRCHPAGTTRPRHWSVACADILPDSTCGAIEGTSEADLLDRIYHHLSVVHAVIDITPALVEKVARVLPRYESKGRAYS